MVSISEKVCFFAAAGHPKTVKQKQKNFLYFWCKIDKIFLILNFLFNKLVLCPKFGNSKKELTVMNDYKDLLDIQLHPAINCFKSLLPTLFKKAKS